MLKKSTKKLLLLGIPLFLVVMVVALAPAIRKVLLRSYKPTFTALDETIQNYNRLFDEPAAKNISSSNSPSLQEMFNEFTEIAAALEAYEDELKNDRAYNVFVSNHIYGRTYSCGKDCEGDKDVDNAKNHQDIWIEYLEKLAPFHDRIRSFSELKGPVYQVDLDQGGPRPHLGAIRCFVRSLSAEIAHLANQGDINGVFQNIKSIWKLSDQLAEEPLSISQMIRTDIQLAAMNIIQKYCPPGSLTIEQSQELIRLTGTEDSTEAFANSFLLDIKHWLYVLDRVRNKDPEETRNYEGRFYLNGNIPPGQILRLFIGSPLQEPFLVREESIYLKFLSPLPDMARQPYHKIAEELETMFEGYEIMSCGQFGAMIVVPNIVAELTYRAQFNAQLGLTRIGLAIEQYEQVHGVLPASLEEVESILSGSVPLDPFTGDPFNYLPGADDFLLYSVGYDKVDDSGEHYDINKGFTILLQRKDIVWRDRGKEINWKDEYEASKKDKEK